MNRKKSIYRWSNIMFLLPILVVLSSYVFKLSITLSISILAVLFMVVFQIAKFLIKSEEYHFTFKISLGTATALIILAGLPSIRVIPFMVWLVLYFSLLIQFTVKIQNKIEYEKHLFYKIILLSVASLTLLGLYLHFGKMTIWLMVSAFLFAILAKRKIDIYGLKWLWTKNWLIVISIAIGITSTIIQFRKTVVLFNLKLLPFIGLTLLAIIVLAVTFLLIRHYFLMRKIRKDGIRYKEEKKRKEKEQKEEKKREEKEQDERNAKTEKLKKEKDLARDNFLTELLNGDNDLEKYFTNISVSNVKKQITWGTLLNDALMMSNHIITASFNDGELILVKIFLEKILKRINTAKHGIEMEYTGEKEIRDKIQTQISLYAE